MASPLTLKLILAGAAKAAADLKPLDKQSRAAAAGLKQSRDALKLLNGQLSQIDGIRKYQGELAKQSTGLKVLQTNLASVTRTYGANSDQARALQGQVAKATAAYDKQRTALLQLRSAASASGIRNLTADQTRLRSEIASTNTTIAQQKARLEALANVTGRKAQMRETFGKTRAVAGNLAMAGAAGLGTAYGIRRAVTEPLHQVRQYDTTTTRIAALGLKPEDTERAIEYAKRMKTFGTSMNDNMGLMLDATTAFADVHHAEMVMPTLAKMKFANTAVFGAENGQENEAKFMDMLKVIEARNGLNSEADFIKQADMVQRVITATGGRVDSTQWLDFLKTGGLAARGLRDDAMYYQLEPLVQAMGGNRVGTATMSAYQNVYQGKTTKRAANLMESLGLIADPSKVTHDKAGQIAQLGVGAIKGAELFQKSQFEWMEKVLLPTLAAKGITGEKEVLDAIGGIFSNRTASGLFGMMFQMREQIHKNAKLNAGAFGIDQLDARARPTVSGREVETMARFHDAMQEAGRAILPTYLSLIETVTSAMQGITNFARENPILASYMGKAVLWLGLLAAGFGAVSLGAAALLGPFAVIRYGLGLFGIKAAPLAPLLTLLGRALGFVATGVLWVGRALLMNPIGLAVTGIATAAFLIYKYWGPISGFFVGLWDRAKIAFANFWQYLGRSMPAALSTIGAAILNWSPLGLFYRAFAEVMRWFGIELPDKFTTFGAQVMQGLVNGITGALGAVRDAISGAAESTLGWFKEKLGIRSPSRVFMEAGGNIVEGAAIGIDRSLPMLRAAALGLAGATTIGMPAMAGAFPLEVGGFDNRPPLAAAAGGRSGASIVVQGDTITIHINAVPGADAQGLARAIRAELDKRDADKRARMRGAFIDYDN
ncbi:phage tail tape measure protein [Variovorax sp. CY25R-8]|uniref:phage tail tape measure protein n=1 Tax=Variovorax sp. CY25R-8 TaxID=2855501 RepID=UPI0021BAC762|nr:phage tail protein [Variovorax sp. CY25R-8]MCT8178123.1 phage tail protein [Variovorax sp. CY25R-8]